MWYALVLFTRNGLTKELQYPDYLDHYDPHGGDRTKQIEECINRRLNLTRWEAFGLSALLRVHQMMGEVSDDILIDPNVLECELWEVTRPTSYGYTPPTPPQAWLKYVASRNWLWRYFNANDGHSQTDWTTQRLLDYGWIERVECQVPGEKPWSHTFVRLTDKFKHAIA